MLQCGFIRYRRPAKAATLGCSPLTARQNPPHPLGWSTWQHLNRSVDSTDSYHHSIAPDENITHRDLYLADESYSSASLIQDIPHTCATKNGGPIPIDRGL